MFKIQMLYAMVTRLSKRERFIFYGAVFFISVMLIDRLIIYPVFHTMKSLDDEIKQRESNIKRNLHIVAQKNKITAESAEYAPLLNSFKTEEEGISSVLKEVEMLANQSSVYLVELKPGDLKKMGTSNKYIVNLICEAQLEQITEFMYNIENSSKLLTIEKYEITPKSTESSIARCTMSIATTIIQ